MGRRTLLICFNRLLGDWLCRQAAESLNSENVTAGSYFRLLRELILQSSAASEFMEHERQSQTEDLFDEVYANHGRTAVQEINKPYDVLVMDEGQDLLRASVLSVLDCWLRKGLADGRWAIFGDFERQALFGTSDAMQLRGALKQVAPDYARGRLSLNCRNTRSIGEETALLSGFESPPYRLAQVMGSPVDYRYYNSPESERKLIAETLLRLLSNGVRASDIVVLSRLRLENSAVGQLDGGKEFRILDVLDRVSKDSATPVIRFATVHAFKGMESPVVVLCDIERVGESEPQSLLYVAMSRARSQLIVLAHENASRTIGECVRRKLHGWGVEHE